MKAKKGILLIAFVIALGPLSIFSSVSANSQDAEQTHLSRDADATAEQNTAIVKQFLDKVVNGGHLDLIDEFWAADMIWHGGSLGDIYGIENYKKVMKANVGGAFIDMHLDIKDIVASGDKVVVRFTNSGKNVGSFMGLKPTYKRAEWIGIGIYQIKNQKITEAWFAEDILNQLLHPYDKG
jgi:predicted ester cyclase